MNILKRSFLIISLIVSGLSAQDKVDAIEAARQAKAAAEKAAADAEAATDAAIEQAAQNAAQGARNKIKQAKLDEEARKVAEAAAAEEAELDAAASAAAEEAKRRMAEELGLEYVPPASDDVVEEVVEESIDASLVTEEVVVKESSGFMIGISPSIGAVSGETFTSIPIGATIIVTTPYGLELGPLDYTVSLAFGGYIGEYDSKEAGADDGPNGPYVDKFNPIVAGLGGNLTLFEIIFAEGHIGLVGKGAGFRGFAGVSMERILKKSLSLPFNLSVGSELFISNDMSGIGNSSGWISLGARLDFSL